MESVSERGDSVIVAAGAADSSVGARLRQMLTNPYLTLVSRLVLSGVFFLAGLSKLGVPDSFVSSINEYEMPLPGFLVQAMAVGLPPLEIALGLMLFAGIFIRVAAAACSGLMLVFMTALIQAWARGLTPECGCVAAGPEANPWGAALVTALGPIGTFLTTGKVGPETVLRDLVFLLMGVHLILVPTIFAIDAWLTRRAQDDEWEGEAV